MKESQTHNQLYYEKYTNSVCERLERYPWEQGIFDQSKRNTARQNGQTCDMGLRGRKSQWQFDPKQPKPGVQRVAHGVARRVDRFKAIGNGQVPQCAALAFSILSEGLTSRLVTNA